MSMILVILINLFVFILIILIMVFINLMIYKKLYMMRVKISSFECGFDMLESIRLPFSINFYLIAVLFLIFDMEIIYLFSMLVSNNLLKYKFWFFCSLMILIILLLGLEYEKKEGSLKWFI